jgi:hypothetical protein
MWSEIYSVLLAHLEVAKSGREFNHFSVMKGRDGLYFSF